MLISAERACVDHMRACVLKAVHIIRRLGLVIPNFSYTVSSDARLPKGGAVWISYFMYPVEDRLLVHTHQVTPYDI